VKTHFERDFYRRRAIVGIKTTVQSRRRNFNQLFRQFDGGLVGESGKNYMLQGIELVF